MAVAHVIVDVATRELDTHFDYAVPDGHGRRRGWRRACWSTSRTDRSSATWSASPRPASTRSLKPVRAVLGGPYFGQHAPADRSLDRRPTTCARSPRRSGCSRRRVARRAPCVSTGDDGDTVGRCGGPGSDRSTTAGRSSSPDAEPFTPGRQRDDAACGARRARGGPAACRGARRRPRERRRRAASASTEAGVVRVERRRRMRDALRAREARAAARDASPPGQIEALGAIANALDAAARDASSCSTA